MLDSDLELMLVEASCTDQSPTIKACSIFVSMVKHLNEDKEQRQGQNSCDVHCTSVFLQ